MRQPGSGPAPGHGMTIALERQLDLFADDDDRPAERARPPTIFPLQSRFPFPIAKTSSRIERGESPRYFSDQKGTFEVSEEPGHGKCLKQIVPEQGNNVGTGGGIVKPFTVIGDQKWSDYALSADVRIDGGDVELGGRFGGVRQSE